MSEDMRDRVKEKYAELATAAGSGDGGSWCGASSGGGAGGGGDARGGGPAGSCKGEVRGACHRCGERRWGLVLRVLLRVRVRGRGGRAGLGPLAGELLRLGEGGAAASGRRGLARLRQPGGAGRPLARGGRAGPRERGRASRTSPSR